MNAITEVVRVQVTNSHDQVGASLDGRGQNMKVVGVRQIESGGACRVPRHSRIRKVLVHHRAGPFQYIHREIGTVLQNIPYPTGSRLA